MSFVLYRQLSPSDAVNNVITLERECMRLSIRNASIDPVATPLTITVNQGAYGDANYTSVSITVGSTPINDIVLVPFKTITINTPAVAFDILVDRYQAIALIGKGQ